MERSKKSKNVASSPLIQIDNAKGSKKADDEWDTKVTVVNHRGENVEPIFGTTSFKDTRD
jgi:hypothetical protein